MAWFDDLPLDYTRPETREAVDLLAGAYPKNTAMLRLARRCGLDLSSLDQDSALRYLVPDVLDHARASKRLLQIFVEVFLDQSVEAFHDQLRGLFDGHEAALAAASLVRKPSLATLALLP